MITTAEDILELIKNYLDDKKAEDIVVIDLRGKTSIAEYMVIATGQSARQIVSTAEFLSSELKSYGVRVGLEGLSQGDWVLIDANDVIVHLFRAEVRNLYNLEKMWGIDTPQSSLPK